MHPLTLARARLTLLCLVVAGAPIASGPGAGAAALATPTAPERPLAATDESEDVARWNPPTSDVVVVAPFVDPPHPYAAGHRGVDLAAPRDSVLVAPAAGVVAFSGDVAGRGVITLDHGGGYVSTLEPVSEALPPGTAVSAGDPVAQVSVGGHMTSEGVHFGVRLLGVYVNPLLLVGGDIARAVLLPCCG
jgi:murein DD-endopeptidase MepM/ murein hydrolase activator NlpD